MRSWRFNPSRYETGVVLIVVIGVLAVLSLIAATFGMLMSVEVAASRNQTEHEMARKAAHAGAQHLLSALDDYIVTQGETAGVLPDFCPHPGQVLGCRELYHRDGVKAYFALHEHPDDAEWTAGLGNEDSGMFNINAMGYFGDLGSSSDYSTRYTSFETSLVRLIQSRFDVYTGIVDVTTPPPTDNATATTLQDFDQHWVRGDDLIGREVYIIGSGQSSFITSHTENELTLSPAWAAPAGSFAYIISKDPAFHITNALYYPTFTNLYERQRIAILLARALIRHRHYGGYDTTPGKPGAEEKRLGHLPRWNHTLNWDITSNDDGIGFPPPAANNKYEFGYEDYLPSLLIDRTGLTTDDWNFREDGIWLTYTGGDWQNDLGVSPSALVWGKIGDPVLGDPAGRIRMDNTLPGSRDWPANRWVDTLAPIDIYYLYLPNDDGARWYAIGDANADGTGSDANYVELFPSSPATTPQAGDPFCIFRAETLTTLSRLSQPGARLDRRWVNVADDKTGDLIPTAQYWPDGTLTTEKNVIDLVVEQGTVTAAENPNPGPPPVDYAYLQDTTKTWVADEWKDDFVIHIYDGDGIGQVRRIIGNDSNKLTIDDEQEWTTIPVDSKYYIEYYDENLPTRFRPDVLQGDDSLHMSIGTLRDSIIVPTIEYDIAPAAQKGLPTSAASGNTLIDTTKTWAVNAWADNVLVIADGKGFGLEMKIISNSSNTLTLEYIWDTALPIPDTTSRYYIRNTTLTNNALAITDILLPQFQKFLGASTRSLEANQELGGINDWRVDGIDNDGNGVIDDEKQTQLQIAKDLYEKLGLRDWVEENDADVNNIKRAAQLIANIIDFCDVDSVPLALTDVDLTDATTPSFTVYGAEGLHVTEVMASPDADFCTNPAEMIDDGGGAPVDGVNWDYLPATLAFTQSGPGPQTAAFVDWTFENSKPGHYALRFIGKLPAGGSFIFSEITSGQTCTVVPAEPDPEDSTYDYAFVRMDTGKLLQIDLTAVNSITFNLQAPEGSLFKGLALLPQYIEITNVAATDIPVNDLVITTDAGTIELSNAYLPVDPRSNWRKIIPGASADGFFPINYGTYVIAMCEEAYERQWSKAAAQNGIWGDAEGEDYPVFFAGDVNDDLAKALLMGAKSSTGNRLPTVRINNTPENALIAGYDYVENKGVDGNLGEILLPEETYSSLEKNVILQPTWDNTNDYWEAYDIAPTALCGSQNVSVTATADAPRSAADKSFLSNLNRQYDALWAAPLVAELEKGSELVTDRIVYPIILNRPYPTVGYLGIVPTSNKPWRSVDTALSGGVATEAGNTGEMDSAGTVAPNAFIENTDPSIAPWEAGTVNDPTGHKIKIIAGDGNTQVRTVVGIKGGASSKILYLDMDWNTIDVPGNGSRYIFLPYEPEEMLGTLMTSAATGGVYARFNINTATQDVLRSVFDDGQSSTIIETRNGLPGKSWSGWDTLLNDPIFQNAPDDQIDMFDNPSAVGFFDDYDPAALPANALNEDSGAGLYADDFMDDSDEREEWARRYGNIFNLRSTAFRFIVAGLVYPETAGSGTPPIAEARIEMDVDLSDPTVGPQVKHFRYLSQ